jgi:hypothetical protein
LKKGCLVVDTGRRCCYGSNRRNGNGFLSRRCTSEVGTTNGSPRESREWSSQADLDGESFIVPQRQQVVVAILDRLLLVDRAQITASIKEGDWSIVAGQTAGGKEEAHSSESKWMFAQRIRLGVP